MAPRKFIAELPGWVQAAIAVLGFLGVVTLAYASQSSDLRNETTVREAETKSLREADQRQERSIDRIEQMLREELDRHHPRRQ
jgi:hypothetical protein